MPTHKHYLEDATALVGSATVTAIVDTDRGPAVRLDRTVFHPQGGGQKADRGTIGGLAVTHVAHAPDGEVNHVVASTDGLAVGDIVELAVHADWRHQSMRYHSGGHLLAALVEAAFAGTLATDGHHWPGESRVQYVADGEGAELPTADAVREALPGAIAQAVGDRLPVVVLGDPQTDRSVQIGKHRPLPCGGTHVADTGDLAGLQVDGVKIKSRKLRVSYSFADDATGDAG